MARPSNRSGKRVPGFTEEFGERLQSVISRIGTMDRASEVSGVSVDQLTAWKFGRSRPDFFALQRLCANSGVSITWLATGEGVDSHPDSSQGRTQQEHAEVPVLHVAPNEFEPGASYVSVPALDIRASAGHGALAEREDVKAYVAFEAAFLRSLGINPNFARILDLTGDSMYPTLKDGDRIVVDTSIEEVIDEGIYAVVLAGRLLIKRMQIRLDGSVVLRSDNREAGYEDIVVDAGELDQMQVVGRVKIRLHLM